MAELDEVTRLMFDGVSLWGPGKAKDVRLSADTSMVLFSDSLPEQYFSLLKPKTSLGLINSNFVFCFIAT